jgi:hypothetical protein
LNHKGRANILLREWISNNYNYVVNDIKADYLNSNYQTKNEDEFTTFEVLITNYVPCVTNVCRQLSLIPIDRKYNEIYRQ